MLGYIVPILVTFISGPLLIYGIIHEQALIDFEDRVVARIRSGWRRKKNGRNKAL